jgi:transcriptional regulator with GAF, ATPase, and Fis domain
MAQTALIVGKCSGLATVLDRVELVATKDIPVLLHGETGTGKEVIAQLIHKKSTRCKNVFIRVNCGAISPELIDSELFGHVKGAFTGATSLHKGWFERADGGTLFLDEIGELPLGAQVRLLRVIQEGCFTRVGGEKSEYANVRIIAATHRHLPEMIENKMFREDLYYRLSGFPIVIPPLRDRLEDIAAFTHYFVEQAVKQFGIKSLVISDKDIFILRQYPWPGNIREFASVINRAVLLGESCGYLQVKAALGIDATDNKIADLPIDHNKDVIVDDTLEVVIRSHIEQIVLQCHGRIEGPFGAAKRLGLNPSTLRSKIRKFKH